MSMQCYNSAMHAKKGATLLDCFYTWSSKTFKQQDANTKLTHTHTHVHTLKTQANIKLAQL